MISFCNFTSKGKDDAIRYCGFDGTLYKLTNFPSDCYVKEGQSSIATFETMSLRGNILHIDHFAVDSSLRGCGKAEALLRGFVQVIAGQSPNISQITFDLHRSSGDSDIYELANARFALLEKIGARNVCQRKANDHCIAVSAVWDKEHWKK